MIEKIKYLLANQTAVFGGIFLISAVSLMTALIAQFIYNLEPCTLCLYQRVPYVITLLLGLIGMVTLYKHEWTRFSALFVLVAGIMFLSGGIIAFYHSGVEQHWWKSFLQGCAIDFDTGKSVNDLMALFESKPAVRCDEIPWADPFFGISMAGYNAILSFILAITCALSALCIIRKKNGLL
ncbi:MAG: disulfide bond formation protein B [Alphaproteobacteria bacterium CG_4_9_14_3_um_filter_47_13]|nr:MAG: disulfide bond formation protein B [Alphaproteobacteria bacterium CG_4_9_14_3_um_filter_47_13]